jgi:hypothetical protein
MDRQLQRLSLQQRRREFKELAWLENNRISNTDQKESIWVRFEPLDNVDDYSQIKMRVVAGDPDKAGEPAGTWVHWHENRSYNCPSNWDCPVCVVRSDAKKRDPEGYNKKYPMNYQYYFNVLVEEGGKPVVKVFSFRNTIGKRLKSFVQTYGDLRDYDIIVRKTKTGKSAMNVEYDAFYKGERKLTDEEQEVIQDLHDLKPFTQPALPEHLSAVARGEVPEFTKEEKPRSKVDLLLDLEDLAAARGLTLSDLEVDPDMPDEKILATIEHLRNS